MGLFSGLEEIGMGGLSNVKVFEDEKTKAEAAQKRKNDAACFCFGNRRNRICLILAALNIHSVFSLQHSLKFRKAPEGGAHFQSERRMRALSLLL